MAAAEDVLAAGLEALVGYDLSSSADDYAEQLDDFEQWGNGSAALLWPPSSLLNDSGVGGEQASSAAVASSLLASFGGIMLGNESQKEVIVDAVVVNTVCNNLKTYVRSLLDSL